MIEMNETPKALARWLDTNRTIAYRVDLVIALMAEHCRHLAWDDVLDQFHLVTQDKESNSDEIVMRFTDQSVLWICGDTVSYFNHFTTILAHMETKLDSRTLFHQFGVQSNWW